MRHCMVMGCLVIKELQCFDPNTNMTHVTSSGVYQCQKQHHYNFKGIEQNIKKNHTHTQKIYSNEKTETKPVKPTPSEMGS